MTKEEIVKELDELGNVLYNKFGTDSYLERCTIHDLKAKIKALTLTDVVVPKGTLCLDCEKKPAVAGYDLNFCEECWENAVD